MGSAECVFGVAVIVAITLLLVAMGAWIVVDSRRQGWYRDCHAANPGDAAHEVCAGRAPAFG